MRLGSNLSGFSKIVDANVVSRYLLNDDDAEFKIVKSFFDDVKTGKTKALILGSVSLKPFMFF
jgi:predicted nucleic-acid-binding protein